MSGHQYWFYKVRREDIYQIKNIIEGYENILNMSTIDRVLPKIQITVPNDYVEESRAILKDLSERFYMEALSDDPHISQARY